MALAKFSLREVKARPTRLILTFLSIAIGVGAVVAVLLATATTRQSQKDMLRAISGKADLEIIAAGPTGFSYDAVASVRATAGVEVAVPSLNRFGVLFAGENKARTQILGIDPRIDQEVRDYEIVAGEQPKLLTEILLDSSFANSLDIEVGDTVKILGRGGLKEFTIVGLVQPSGNAALALSSAAYMVLPAAQSAFRTGNNIDQIQLIVQPDVDAQLVLQSLQSVVPEGATIRAPRTQSDMADEMIYGTENGLYMAIAFSLLIATFIIYNTFQMTVGERRKQLGILRAIGATRSQVHWMILKEALWISLFASVFGCFLGVWGASYLNQATEQLLQVQLPRVQLSVLPFIVAGLLGVGVSLIGAILPARRAGSVSPVEAMRAVELHHNDEVIAKTKMLGAFVLPLGVILLLCTLGGRLPVGTDVVAIVGILLGFVLLIPMFLQFGSLAISRFMSRWLGIEAVLAQKQLVRHIGRTSLTIGVLFVAISTSTGMAGNVLDNVENVKSWYRSAIVGDFFIRASMPDLATGAAADIPPELGEKLKKIEGIESLDPMRFVNAQSAGDSVLVVVRDFIGKPTDFFDIVDGSSEGAVQGLNNKQAVIGSVLAKRREVTVGDTIPLQTPDGVIELEIAATANDYVGGGLTIYLDRSYAAELLGVEGVDAYVIIAEKSELVNLEARLSTFCQENGLILQSYSELVQFIDGLMNGVIASLWMLLTLGCTIAAMGLVNTLTMSILEQTREIGMLRVVAMTRSQVRRLIFAQAALLGLLGLVPGAIAGIFVAYAISLSAYAVLGHNILFHFRPGLIAGCLAFGFIIVMLASLIPAERAARLKLGIALHYE